MSLLENVVSCIIVCTNHWLGIFFNQEPAEVPELPYKSSGVRPIALQAKDQDEKDTGPPNCKKLMLVMAKRMLKVLNGCVKELKEKYTDKESLSEHFQCSLKCFMFRVNMVSAFTLRTAVIGC